MVVWNFNRNEKRLINALPASDLPVNAVNMFDNVRHEIAKSRAEQAN